MIVHTVTFRWRSEVTQAQTDTLHQALQHFRGIVPGLRSCDHGPDLGLREDNADYAVVAAFDGPVSRAIATKGSDLEKEMKQDAAAWLTEVHSNA